MPSRTRTKTNCGVCLQKIVDGKEEAIFCEGKCQQWYHRGCASVPRELFATLTTSNVPFHCLTCSNSSLQQEVADLTLEIRRFQESLSVISKLRDENAALSREVTELRQKLENLSQGSSTSDTRESSTDAGKPRMPHTSYARVTRTGLNRRITNQPRRPREDTRSQNRTTSGNSRIPGAGASSAKNINQQKVTRVTVPGVRRVWGTKKDASTTVVLQTIRQLTKIDPEKQLTVKRKFQDGESGRRDRWWFLISGSEATLGELERLWSCVSLQVGWKLEECTKPKNDGNGESNENVDANPNSEESNEVFNGSSTSPASSSANTPETSETSCPNQLSNKQTGCIDINKLNVNSGQSGSATSKRNNNTSSPEEVSQDHSFLDQTQHKTPAT